MTSSASRERSTREHRGDERELGDDVARRGAVDRVLDRRRRSPSSAATAAGSRPSDEPASAPEPYGEQRPRARPSRASARRRAAAATRAPAGGARAGPAARAAGACGRASARRRAAVGLVDERVDDVEHQAARRARACVAQVHPDERGDLVVARAAGAQLAAEVGARPLDQPALERGVHVLVVEHRQEVAAARRRPRSRSSASTMPASSSSVEQTGAVQDAGVRDASRRCRTAASRQSKCVDCDSACERLRRAAGEPAAPQRDVGRRPPAGVVRHSRSRPASRGPRRCRSARRAPRRAWRTGRRSR